MRSFITFIVFILITPIYGIDHFISLPLTRQSTDYTCGAAITTSILGYYGEITLESEVARLLGTNPDYGTDSKQMLKFFQEKGYTVSAHDNMSIEELKSFVSQGIPVICLIQAWADTTDYSNFRDIGHYVVAIGYDEHNLYFLDPWMLGTYGSISIDDFKIRWKQLTHENSYLMQWGMAVSKEKPAFDPMDTRKPSSLGLG